MRKRNAVIVSLLLIYTIVVPVFAYIYFNKTEPTFVTAGIVLQTPTMKLGIYWDREGTQPVTSFDFGKVAHPAQPLEMSKHIYIRNEGDVWHLVLWNSTLSSVTNEIEETWNHWDGSPVNGTTLQPGAVADTFYTMSIHAYPAFGTYNWTLTAWGEYCY